MAAKKANVCVQVEEPLLSALDKRVRELCNSGQETDRSKYIRNLLRRDLDGKKAEGC
jgi:Arc/MetJ-type ribon-helix-helix transcriptional regulator